jgi:hypothetical protein
LGPYVSFRQQTPAVEVVRRVASGGWQDVFPVLSEDQTVVGIITSEILRTIAQEPGIAELTIADDMMLPPVVVQDDNDVSSALEVLLDTTRGKSSWSTKTAASWDSWTKRRLLTRLYHASTHASAA